MSKTSNLQSLNTSSKHMEKLAFENQACGSPGQCSDLLLEEENKQMLIENLAEDLEQKKQELLLLKDLV